jgi:hypothetical protein
LVASGHQIPRRNDQTRFFATIRLFLWSKPPREERLDIAED